MERIKLLDANPFLGLTPFDRASRKLFFGREKDAGLIQGRLVSARTTLLFSGSGVGKSSFVNAKLIPDLEADYRVTYHNRWSVPNPLGALQASCGEESLDPAKWSHSFRGRRTLLILDQFEELFQYHKDGVVIRSFVEGIAGLINAAHPVDVRVLVAMREEFLGELSIFDSRIPDIFANYYRLRNPNQDQAKSIIEKTASAAGVECDSTGLETLISDLRNIFSAESEVLPDLVAPPYLQMVCYRLWRNAMPEPEKKRFLDDYAPGRAALELEQYCRESLDPLTPHQRALVSDALGYLVGRGGAKRGYHLTELAELLGAPDPRPLQDTLQYLSTPAVRIMRGPSDNSETSWFELYHDMYAPFLCQWKADYDKERRREKEELEAHSRTQQEALDRQRLDAEEQERALQREKEAHDKELIHRRELEFELRLKKTENELSLAKAEESRRSARRRLYGIGSIILAILGYFGLYHPYGQFTKLRDAVENPDAVQNVGVEAAYHSLAYLPFWKTKSKLLWKQYWERRANQAASRGNSEDALLYYLKRIAVEPDDMARREGNALLDHLYGNLHATFRSESTVGLVAYSEKRNEIIATHQGGTILRWDFSNGRPKPTIHLGSNQSLFDYTDRELSILGLSVDGTYAVTGSRSKDNGTGWALFDLTTFEQIQSGNVPFLARSATFSDAGQLFSIVGSGEARICQIADKKSWPINIPSSSFGPYSFQVAFSEDGQLVAVLSSGRIRVLSTATHNTVKESQLSTTNVMRFGGSIKFDAYGRLIVFPFNSPGFVWDLKSDKQSPLPYVGFEANSILLPGGRILLLNTGSVLRFIDLNTLKELYLPQPITGALVALVGNKQPQVLTRGDNAIRCWQIELRKPTQLLPATNWLLNRTGRMLADVAAQGTLRILNSATGAVQTLTKWPEGDIPFAWSDDDQALLATKYMFPHAALHLVPLDGSRYRLLSSLKNPTLPTYDFFFPNAAALFYRDSQCVLLDAAKDQEQWRTSCDSLFVTPFGVRGVTYSSAGLIQTWRGPVPDWRKDSIAFPVNGDIESVRISVDGRRVLAWSRSTLFYRELGKVYRFDSGDASILGASFGPGPELITAWTDRLQILKCNGDKGTLAPILQGDSSGNQGGGPAPRILTDQDRVLLVQRGGWYQLISIDREGSPQVIMRYSPLGGLSYFDQKDDRAIRFAVNLFQTGVAFSDLNFNFGDVSPLFLGTGQTWDSFLHRWEQRLGRRINSEGKTESVVPELSDPSPN